MLATCVALYHISTAFPQSLYGKCITFVLILYPIWAIGSHPEIRSNVPALVASSSLPVFTFTSTLQHPAQILVERARKSFADKLSKQSRTLDEAVSEYVRRYKRSPPPGFDKWFHFAKENNVQFIDEYDLMTKSFEPFWAAEPRVLRNYIDQAIEIDGANLNTLDVKQGKATLSGGSFQHAQLIELLGPVVSHAHFLTVSANVEKKLTDADAIPARSQGTVKRIRRTTSYYSVRSAYESYKTNFLKSRNVDQPDIFGSAR